MAIVRRLEDFLKRNNAHYRAVAHEEAFTAQEVAAAMHVRGQELVKSVMVKADGNFVMAVLPASSQVDFPALKKVLGGQDVKLASEEEFKALFPDCEPGAEPPFGGLYDVDMIVDESLSRDERIYFNAGNHHEAVEMPFKEYSALVKPRFERFARQ